MPITAEQLTVTIKEKISNVTHVEVKDVGGGCGSKFEAFIVSEAFEGLKLLQRQRMVNSAIEEEMKEIHAFIFKKTITPKQYEEWQKTNQ